MIAAPPQSDDAFQIDDVAAVHADKMRVVQPRLHLSDRQRTEELRGSVEDLGVVRIRVHGDDVADRDEMIGAVAYHRENARGTGLRGGSPH